MDQKHSFHQVFGDRFSFMVPYRKCECVLTKMVDYGDDKFISFSRQWMGSCDING